MRTGSVRAGVTAAAIVVMVAVVIPAALAQPPEQALATAVAAAERGQSVAREKAQGPKDESKSTGLDRAAEALAKVAEKRAAQTSDGMPGNGFGRGHAAAVHEILAAGGSPSELAPHGETVSGLAKAYQAVRAENHPGKGHGPGGNPDKGDDDD